MGLASMPLLALGFLLGAVVYAMVGYAVVAGVRTAIAGLVALYWRWRTERDAARETDRVASMQQLPRARAPEGSRRSRPPRARAA